MAKAKAKKIKAPKVLAQVGHNVRGKSEFLMEKAKEIRKIEFQEAQLRGIKKSIKGAVKENGYPLSAFNKVMADLKMDEAERLKHDMDCLIIKEALGVKIVQLELFDRPEGAKSERTEESQERSLPSIPKIRRVAVAD